MKAFSKLHHLHTHLDYLHAKIPHTQLFAVGGCVRDVLLGKTFHPTDVDVTCAGEPLSLAQQTDTSDVDFFQTEKYGTFTLIRKILTDQKANMCNTTISYEITPFRAEGTYTDLRHPDELEWTNNLYLDSQRRDFTINAIYYTTVTFSHLTSKASDILHQSTETLADDTIAYPKQLQETGAYFDPTTHILVLQKQELITACFPDGKVDNSYLFSVVKMLSPEQQPHSIGVLVDPQCGLADIDAKKIRCVGVANDRLQEDALRIIRAVRFAVTLEEFDFIKETWQALEDNYALVESVPAERIGQEIMKTLYSDNFFGFVALIDELKLLPTIFPHLARNKFDPQPNRYHPFDTYTHILLTLHELEKINKDPAVKMAMLYHDVGKKDQYAIVAKTDSRKEAFDIYGDLANHSLSGPKFAQEDMQKFAWGKQMINDIKRYIQEHMRPGEILFSKPEKWKRKLRLLYSVGGYKKVRNLLDIVIADRRGHYNPMQSVNKNLAGVYTLIDLLDELEQEEGQFTPKDLAVSGNDIMEKFAIKPGPQIKIYLDHAMKRVLDDVNKRNKTHLILKQLGKLKVS